ncbi:uncharacterized protein LOC136759459 [Amia ocellicauda]|uniref:uncharacterized protein LOC136759459 n=1 Tax=Amia ocellicauda TaxID=2972642 RepID=UPI003464BAC5
MWNCLGCCQRPQDKDAQPLSAERKDGGDPLHKDENDMTGPASLQAYPSQVNAGYRSPVRHPEGSGSVEDAAVRQKQITDLQERSFSAQMKYNELTISGGDLSGVVYCIDQTAEDCVPVSSSGKNDREYKVISQQLELANIEKRELEAKVFQANQSVRDLKHEIAVLQKRLQLAENPLPSAASPSPTTPPPPPPPLPPPPPPPLNPLRSILWIIQKRKEAKSHGQPALQHTDTVPPSPVKTADPPSSPQSPGMHEMLEMIKSGVSLRHVVQKDNFKYLAGQVQNTETGSSRSHPEPELQSILRRRRESADQYISDASCEEEMLEGTSQHTLELPAEGISIKRSPGKGNLNLLCQQPDTEQEQTGRELEREPSDSSRDGTGHEAICSSTLNRTAPLNSGIHFHHASPDDAESHPLTASADLPLDSNDLELQAEDHIILGAILTDLMATLKNQGLPDEVDVKEQQSPAEDFKSIREKQDSESRTAWPIADLASESEHLSSVMAREAEVRDVQDQPKKENQDHETHNVSQEGGTQVLTAKTSQDLSSEKNEEPVTRDLNHSQKGKETYNSLQFSQEEEEEEEEEGAVTEVLHLGQSLSHALEGGDETPPDPQKGESVSPFLLQKRVVNVLLGYQEQDYEPLSVLKKELVDESVDGPEQVSLLSRGKRLVPEHTSFDLSKVVLDPPLTFQNCQPPYVGPHEELKPLSPQNSPLQSISLIPITEDAKTSLDEIFF